MAAVTEGRPWLRFYEPGVPHSLTYPNHPVYVILDRTAASYGARPAYVFFGAQLTFETLRELTGRFAAALVRLGIRPGDRVAVHLPNCPQFLIAYYGTLRTGATVVPFNPLYVAREIGQQLADSGAEASVTLDVLYPRIAEVRAQTRVREVIVTGIQDFFPPLLRTLYPLKARREKVTVHVPRAPDVHRLIDLIGKPARAPEVPVDPASVAVLLYTGGTTGIPKGAMLTHRNLVSNVLQARSWFTQLHPGEDTGIAVLPFFHSYGMTSAMNFCVSSGTRLALLPRFQPDQVLKAIARYRPKVFPGVPTMYTAINNHPDVTKYDLRSIGACISGAAALPVEVQSRFESITGGRLVEGYGLTEASPITHANPILGTRKAGSIGIPFPDTDARIVDLEGGMTTLGPGEVGELIIRGPQIMQGYWNRADETAGVLRGGWLYTGDMAKMDEDGYFYIVDRKKEMIITGGFNVFPREIEEALYTHPAVLEAAAIGVPDRYKGEVAKAFVVLKSGAQATPGELIDHCRKLLAPFKVPRDVAFREQLPKSLVGKILRRVLAEEERTKVAAP
jgi:long-chain acyl-CoA synthetase